MEEYKPTIPPMVRTITYYVGVLASALLVVVPDYPILVRVAAGIGVLASAFGVAYRPTK